MDDDPEDRRDATRRISWIKAAKKNFSTFPERVQTRMLSALEIAASGQTADIAKPMKGLGAGVFEIALEYKKDAYRTVYAVKLDDDIWVVHAFQKKSTQGIQTPKAEIGKIKNRLNALKGMLANDG